MGNDSTLQMFCWHCLFCGADLSLAFSDIVDTEPFQGGNLLKMLLGSIWDWFDNDSDEPG